MIVNDAPHIARKGAPRLSDAVDRIPADAEAHEMCDPYDIGEVLTQLAESGEPISIYSGRSRDPVMARIDSVDPELPHFVLDVAGGASLAHGEPALLVASLGNDAKMQFELPDDWKVLSGQAHMLRASFPETCLVINRRAERRFEMPVGGNYTATFVILSKKRVLQLYDFSVGGIGMRAQPQEAMGLRVGKKIDGVRIDVGDESVTVDLEIRLARRFRTFLLGEQVQIGCRFVNLTPEAQQKLSRIMAHHGGVGHRRAGDALNL